jgi:hypothetical protein
MKPPLFSQPSSDTPQQYLHRARMFRDAAMSLADYANAEQNWPKYALLTHAAELALKAYVRHSVAKGTLASKEPRQHDLSGWYQLAMQYGLPDQPTVSTYLDVLNDLHRTHYFTLSAASLDPNTRCEQHSR